MNTIDWSKAPKNATHALMLGDQIEFAWAKYPEGGGHASFHATYDNDASRTDFYMERSGWKIVSCRGTFPPIHSIPHWDGSGLPPVGAVCEHQPYEDKQDWHKVEIIAHKNTGLPVAVFWDEANKKATDSSLEAFRPIRTPEQIAADERLHEIRNALTTIKAGQKQFPNDLVRGNITLSVVEAMIDAGYRKQVQP